VVPPSHGFLRGCDANQKPRSHDTPRIAWAKVPLTRLREIVADLAAAPPDLRAYVADRLAQLLARGDSEVLVAAHLMPDSDSQDRLPFVVDRIRRLIAAGSAA
jgi:hypothetical protein